jgi:hypothetical protein
VGSRFFSHRELGFSHTGSMIDASKYEHVFLEDAVAICAGSVREAPGRFAGAAWLRVRRRRRRATNRSAIPRGHEDQ